MDLSFALDQEAKQANKRVDILQDWPSTPEKMADESQWAALRQMLTRKLSIIQGPPGTGKTHVSVLGLRVLLESKASLGKPIVVAAQTNHALDQLLRHISCFDENYFRLGGRSTSAEVKKRTLYEVRKKENVPPPRGSIFGRAKRIQENLAKEMIETLAPLTKLDKACPIGPDVLRKFGIITENQENSLAARSAQWVSSACAGSQDPMSIWLGGQLMPFEINYDQGDFGSDEGDEDEDFEELKELEAERTLDDDEDLDRLRGPYHMIADSYICKTSTSSRTHAQNLLAKHQDLWDIPQHFRGAVYQLFQHGIKAAILRKFREQARQYADIARQIQVGRWERDAVLLQQAHIIGMTTTGFSKYRPLVASLKPKIVLVEEAAEVIEGPVAAVCVESLEHLILVGDHQQLQGHCNIQELETDFHLNVSMFERLVQNGIPFETLTRQRRMDPEIRRVLAPIYSKLDDHPSVIDRPTVPGMGDVRSFFFDHEWSEDSDSANSKYNDQEAEFVVGFFCYLVQAGLVPAHRITVLTFYNGQKRRIKKLLNQKDFLAGEHTSVNTVDSYQGEENAVILLSLVRSNEQGTIGFLDISNRVCVALSRARLGFYVFGNSAQLRINSLWAQVMEIMASSPNRVGTSFPVHCLKHSRPSEVRYPSEWNGLYGCNHRCEDVLSCGHQCPLTCHAFSHDMVICKGKCRRYLICGHPCRAACADECCCETGCEDFFRLSARTGHSTIMASHAPSPGAAASKPMEIRGNNNKVNKSCMVSGTAHDSVRSLAPRNHISNGVTAGPFHESDMSSNKSGSKTAQRHLRSDDDWNSNTSSKQSGNVPPDNAMQNEVPPSTRHDKSDLLIFQGNDMRDENSPSKVTQEHRTTLKSGRVRFEQEYWLAGKHTAPPIDHLHAGTNELNQAHDLPGVPSGTQTAILIDID